MSNCKLGDLAIIVRSRTSPQDIGKIVTCVKLRPSPDGNPAWIIDPPLTNGIVFHEGRYRLPDWIADECLRPIRPGNGEDETLTWKDVPTKEEA